MTLHQILILSHHLLFKTRIRDMRIAPFAPSRKLLQNLILHMKEIPSKTIAEPSNPPEPSAPSISFPQNPQHHLHFRKPSMTSSRPEPSLSEPDFCQRNPPSRCPGPPGNLYVLCRDPCQSHRRTYRKLVHFRTKKTKKKYSSLLPDMELFPNVRCFLFKRYPVFWTKNSLAA